MGCHAGLAELIGKLKGAAAPVPGDRQREKANRML